MSRDGNRIYVRPAVGWGHSRLHVRDPRTGRPIPEDGQWMPRGQDLFRRMRDGDLEETDAPGEGGGGGGR